MRFPEWIAGDASPAGVQFDPTAQFSRPSTVGTGGHLARSCGPSGVRMSVPRRTGRATVLSCYPPATHMWKRETIWTLILVAPLVPVVASVLGCGAAPIVHSGFVEGLDPATRHSSSGDRAIPIYESAPACSLEVIGWVDVWSKEVDRDGMLERMRERVREMGGDAVIQCTERVRPAASHTGGLPAPSAQQLGAARAAELERGHRFQKPACGPTGPGYHVIVGKVVRFAEADCQETPDLWVPETTSPGDR